MANYDIDLCNLEYLFEDVAGRIPAKIVAQVGQDYNVILSNPSQSSAKATLSMRNQCISDIGKLNMVFPIETENPPYLGINIGLNTSIGEIVCTPAAHINIASNSFPFSTCHLGKISSSKPISITMSLDANTTIGQINSTDLSLTQITGSINEIKPGRDASEVDINSCILSNTKMNTSGIIIRNRSLITQCELITNITGELAGYRRDFGAQDKPQGVVAREVPTITIDNSIVKNCTVSGYNISYKSPGSTLIFDTHPEPFDLVFQYKEVASVTDFRTVAGSFEADPDWKVEREQHNSDSVDADASYISKISSTNGVSIRGFNNILSSFVNVGSVGLSLPVLRQSGQLIPAKPDATPPTEARMIPTYLSGAPSLNSNILTVAKQTEPTLYNPEPPPIRTSISLKGIDHPHDDYKSIGYLHVNSNIEADIISLEKVSNLGTINCDHLQIDGTTSILEDGRSEVSNPRQFLNYGTLNYNKKLGIIMNMPGGMVNGDSTAGEIE